MKFEPGVSALDICALMFSDFERLRKLGKNKSGSEVERDEGA